MSAKMVRRVVYFAGLLITLYLGFNTAHTSPAAAADNCSTYRDQPAACKDEATKPTVQPCSEAYGSAPNMALYTCVNYTPPQSTGPAAPAGPPTLGPPMPPATPDTPPTSPAPPVDAPPPAAPTDPAVPADPAAAPTATPAATPATGASTQTKTHNIAVGKGSGLFGPIDVTDKENVPVSHYDLYADTSWDPIAKVILFLANLVFAISRFLVSFAVWLLDFALGFGMLDILRGPAESLTTTLNTQLIGPLDLKHLVLFVAGVMVAVMWMRGRHGRALKEMVLTLVIGAAAAVFLSNPASVLMGQDGILTQSRDFANEISAITLGGGASTGTANSVSGPIHDELVEDLIARPHQLMQYGKVLDDPQKPDPCAGAYRAIIAGGPWWSDSDVAYDIMDSCNSDLADYANDSSLFERLMGAIATAVAGGLVSIVLIGMSITLLLLVFVLLRDALLLVFDLLRGQLPGGREALIARLRSLLEIVFCVMGTIFLLTGFLFLERAILSSAGDSLIVRFILMDLIAIALFKYRKRLNTAVKGAAHRVTARLRTTDNPGGSSSRGPGAGSASRWHPLNTTGAAALGAGAGAVVGAAATSRDRITNFKRAFVAPPDRSASDGKSGSGEAGSPDPSTPAGASTGRGGAPGAGQRPKNPRNAPEWLRSRIANAPVGRNVQRAAKVAAVVGSAGTGAAALALKSTVGLPVYGPRAGRALKAQAQQRTAAAKDLVRSSRAAVDQRKAQATSFKNEYVAGARAAVRPFTSAGEKVGAAVSAPSRAARAVTAWPPRQTGGGGDGQQQR